MCDDQYFKSKKKLKNQNSTTGQMTANDIITLPSLSSTRKMNDMDTF
ncbi:hypothetical protein DERF_000709 [Dermatophagoides farinae]|uniref:Uncharacterized protein n=1 Tax=Dermatophagoides farinae TaxID=6954 RepID=A0A922L8X4_DERFA|nr:hypothetical protein DERF_000709 [Dermatophagoides farinae]